MDRRLAIWTSLLYEHIEADDFIHTVSLHESLEIAVPVSSYRLDIVHAVEVVIRHHVVFCIAGYIDHLPKKQTLVKNLPLVPFSSSTCSGHVKEMQIEKACYPTVLLPKWLWHKLHRKMGFDESRGGRKLICLVFSCISIQTKMHKWRCHFLLLCLLH